MIWWMAHKCTVYVGNLVTITPIIDYVYSINFYIYRLYWNNIVIIINATFFIIKPYKITNCLMYNYNQKIQWNISNVYKWIADYNSLFSIIINITSVSKTNIKKIMACSQCSQLSWADEICSVCTGKGTVWHPPKIYIYSMEIRHKRYWHKS